MAQRIWTCPSTHCEGTGFESSTTRAGLRLAVSWLLLTQRPGFGYFVFETLSVLQLVFLLDLG